jgi:hypothetical protein
MSAIERRWFHLKRRVSTWAALSMVRIIGPEGMLKALKGERPRIETEKHRAASRAAAVVIAELREMRRGGHSRWGSN